MIPWLNGKDPFPSVDNALIEPNGLLAVGGDLSVARLLTAYRSGIFPWYSQVPILWWSPDPRMVLFPRELKISRSLKKILNHGEFEIRSDTAFRDVMLTCAEPRRAQPGTWINEDMLAAYYALHEQGWAHSIETWHDNQLVGGLYGVAIGRAFFGESMFTRKPNASKVALVYLVDQLSKRGFGIIDCQMKTAHLASLGAREISRSEFTLRLEELVNYESIIGLWKL